MTDESDDPAADPGVPDASDPADDCDDSTGPDRGDDSTGPDPGDRRGDDDADPADDGDDPDGRDVSPDPAGPTAFAAELDRARELLAADDLTAFHVGAVRDGESVETTFASRTEGVDVEREGIQALTLLATHLRVVAEESGVDLPTAATDAVSLARQVEETPRD